MKTAFWIAAAVTTLSTLTLIVCFFVEMWSTWGSDKAYKIGMTSYALAMVSLVTAMMLAYAIY